MRKTCICLFFLSFPFLSFTQGQDAYFKDIQTLLLGSSKQYWKNKKKFNKLYPISEQTTVSFSNCKLIGIERDVRIEGNYYFFRDQNGIVFTVFEYYNLEGESLDTVYNLNLTESKNCLFDFEVYTTLYVYHANLNCQSEHKLFLNYTGRTQIVLTNRDFISNPTHLFIRNLKTKCI